MEARENDPVGESEPATEEQSEGFGDDVAEPGAGEQGPPPDQVEDELTEGPTVDPSP